MSVKLEQELQRFLGLTLAIEEENGKYVLTNDQLETLLNKYRVLVNFLRKLLDERQRIEFLLAEYRLKRLGIKKANGYLN